MPVVELRGGIPVGLWMGLPIAQVFVLCVLGNLAPVPIILAALRSERIQKAAKPFLQRARRKVQSQLHAISKARLLRETLRFFACARYHV